MSASMEQSFVKITKICFILHLVCSLLSVIRVSTHEIEGKYFHLNLRHFTHGNHNDNDRFVKFNWKSLVGGDDNK